jgi:hypothetical protein
VNLSELMERQRKRGALIETLIAFHADDPEFLREIGLVIENGELRAIHAPTPSDGKVPQVRVAQPGDSGSYVNIGRVNVKEAIYEYFMVNDNPWFTSDVIAADMGLNPKSVAHVLYHSKKSHFEQRKPPGSRAKEFRLLNPGNPL